MDPEVAKKRRERSKQRALKAQMLFSSNPDAKHLFNNIDNKNDDTSPKEAEQTLPNNKNEVENLLNSAPNISENIEKQSTINDNIEKENYIKAKENNQTNENHQIKENLQTTEKKQTKEINNTQRNEQLKENAKLDEDGQIKESEQAKENKKVKDNEQIKEIEQTKEVKENEQMPKVEISDYNHISNEPNHCFPQNKKNNLDFQNAPDLLPKETKSPSIISSILSIRSIPFLFAPIFSYLSIPYGFLILVLMDIVLFFITHKFEGIISMIKNVYEYIQEFSLRVTSLQCVILVIHILISFLPSSSNEEL